MCGMYVSKKLIRKDNKKRRLVDTKNLWEISCRFKWQSYKKEKKSLSFESPFALFYNFAC